MGGSGDPNQGELLGSPQPPSDSAHQVGGRRDLHTAGLTRPGGGGRHLNVLLNDGGGGSLVTAVARAPPPLPDPLDPDGQEDGGGSSRVDGEGYQAGDTDTPSSRILLVLT